MPLTSLPRRVIAALAVLLVGLSVAGPVDASPEERRVEAAQERLRDVRAELERARESQDAEARALEVAEERVEEVLGAVESAERAVERQERAVEAAQAQLEELTQEADERERVLRDRVAELYRSGGHGQLTGLLTADSPGDVLRRSALIEAVNRSDRRVMEDVAASRRAMDAQAARLQQEQASLERALAQQRELLAEAEALREDKAVAVADAEQRLDKLEGQETRLAAERRELAAAAERAAQPRADRSSRSSSASSDSSESVSSGGWRWPSGGTVTSEYGRRWGRMHEGIDVAAGHGSPVVAAKGGTVSHAGRQGGYGNLVIVDHGGGVQTAYGHFSSISVRVGQQVSAGQRLGGMGCTGSCTGTHVHFEVRVNGSARNPRAYLP